MKISLKTAPCWGRLFGSLLIILFFQSMDAKPPGGKGKGEKENPTAQGSAEAPEETVERSPWSEEQRAALQSWAASGFKGRKVRTVPTQQRQVPPGLPPGLAKKYARTGQLPPGWQKKVQAGQPLDLMVYQETRQVPVEVLERFPHPQGTQDIFIEDKVYRVIKGTREILDILDLDKKK